MKLKIGLLCLWLLTCRAAAVAQAKIDQVLGWVAIQPTTSQLKARLTYSYANGPAAQDQLDLMLDGNLTVSEVQCRNLKDFDLKPDPDSPMAGLMNTLTIRLTKPLLPYAVVRIRLSYAGTMPLHSFDGVAVPANWIESSFNVNCTTPVRRDLLPSTYAVEIRTDRNHAVFAPGQVKPRGPGRTTIRSRQPVQGLNFILGQGLRAETYSWNANTITLISHQASDSLKRGVVEMAGQSLDFYNRTFGQRAPRTEALIALRPTAAIDASYASGNNYLVTYDPGKSFFTKQAFHFGNISHEIGHFWWHHANFRSVDRWLNESFAEYVSLRAKREYLGREVFERDIEELKSKIKRLPAQATLANHEPRGAVSNLMAYSQGPLLLHRLEEKWGEARFLAVLTAAAAAEIKTRRDFIAVVEKVLGSAEAASVAAMTEAR